MWVVLLKAMVISKAVFDTPGNLSIQALLGAYPYAYQKSLVRSTQCVMRTRTCEFVGLQMRCMHMRSVHAACIWITYEYHLDCLIYYTCA